MIVDRTFIDRMASIREATADTEDVDQSARSRMFVISAQWQMFLDYPLGTGHRGTAVLSSRYLEDRWLTGRGEEDRARSSHNTFMTTLVEQGIPGALLYIWLAAWTLSAMFKLRSLERRHGDPEVTTLAATAGAVMAVVFVSGNTADFLMAEVQFWIFAVLVTLLQFERRPAMPAPEPIKAPMRRERLPSLTKGATGS